LALVLVMGAAGACAARNEDDGYRPGKPRVYGTPSPTLTPTPTSPRSRPPECVDADDAFAVEPPDAGLGHRGTVVTLLNCGLKTEVVNGYPELKVLDGDRKPLGVVVKNGSSYFGLDRGPSRVEVKPGMTVRAIIGWSATVTDGEKTTGAYVSVASARGQAPQILPLETDLGTTGEIAVTAWAVDLPH
jgi:hypothetical protein